LHISLLFSFNPPPTPVISTLFLHDALPISTSREHTVVFSRVPDRHVDEALEVMTDMVFAPRFAELDQEREVVLEEIAMYEDTPQDRKSTRLNSSHLVISYAVFCLKKKK